MSRWLILATGLAGVLQLLLAIAAPPVFSGPGAEAQHLGAIMGATVIWPLIIIGLFSIGRRFRTARARTIILLIIWGLFCLSHAQRFAAAQRRELTEAQVRRLLESGVRSSSTPRNGLHPSHEASPTTSQTTAGRLEFRLAADPFSPELRPKTAPSPALVAPPAASAASAVADDAEFSRGSDKRLIERLEHAQEDEYHRVVAGYAHAIEARPGDARLALERLRFIERFSFSEDVTIASAEDDRQRATDYLYSVFPDEPGTVLHRLGTLWGAELEQEAQAYAAAVRRWPAADAAAFHLMRARAAAATGSSEEARRLALMSFESAPTADAAILYTRHIGSDATARSRSLDLLQHSVFEAAEPWVQRQQLDLLFTVGAEAPALALYDRLREAAPEVLADTELAASLARAGRVDAARSILADVEVTEWNRARELRLRYEFELEHGSGEQALKAYRDWRDAGPMNDFLLRERLRLLQRHPGAAWTLEDLPGALMLALVFLVSLACPLVVLLPIHYWSLLRQRRGKAAGWPGASWNLKHAWLLLGAHAGAVVVALWCFAPDTLAQWMADDTDAPATVIPAADLYRAQLWIWAVVALLAAALLHRARAWRLFRPTCWGWWKSIGIGCGLAVVLRMVLGLVDSLVPGGLVAPAIEAGTIAESLFGEILDAHGAGGLFLIVGLAVPVLEEVMFRGVLLQAFARHIPFGWANVVQAAGFALIHENLPLMPFYFTMGVCTGILARRSGSLLAPIAVHAMNNTLACIVLATLHAGG